MSMFTHAKRYFIVLITFAIVLSTTSLTVIAETTVTKEQTEEIYQLISRYHISGTAESRLAGKTVDEMIKELNDPHTVYFNEDEWKKFMDSLENDYVGIGIRISQDTNGVYVVDVFEGSPAKQAGMEPGDYIFKVDDRPANGKTTEQLVNEITGTEGTSVKVTVLRGTEEIDFTIIRKAIHAPVVASKVFPANIGYIEVMSFSSDSDERFAEHLQNLKQQGIQSLIVDLRGNPGGLLDSAYYIAEQFIEEGVMIYVRGNDRKETAVSILNGSTVDMPVVVLINGGSASASEVLTGALQDYGLATVIGTQSYGKGSVQSLFPISGGGMLKLTVQEYLTPKKKKVDQRGITPDITVYGSTAQLLTSLDVLGLENKQIEIGPRSMKINDVVVNERFDWFAEQKQVYVPSRVLAAFIDANIKWEQATKTIVIHDGNVERKYRTVSDYSITKQGTTYIELSQFAKDFQDFEWSWNSETNTLLLREE